MARDRSVCVEANTDDVPPPPRGHSSLRSQFREAPASAQSVAQGRSLPSSSSVPSGNARYIRSTTTPPLRRPPPAQPPPAEGSDGDGNSKPEPQARELRGKQGAREGRGSKRMENGEGGTRAQEGAGGGGAQEKAGVAGVAREVLFVKGNVAVHPSASSSRKIAGQLRLVKHGADVFLNWIPYEPSSPAGTPKGIARGSLLYSIRSVAVSEMRSIRRHTPPFGWHYIIIVLTSGVAFPPLYFYDGGVKEFLHVLKQHVMLERSLDDPNVYNVNQSFDLLQRSLARLHLWDPPSTDPAEPPASANFRSMSLPAARRHAPPFRPSAPPAAAAAAGGAAGRGGAGAGGKYRLGERSASAVGPLRASRALGSVSEDEGEGGEDAEGAEGGKGKGTKAVRQNKLPPSLAPRSTAVTPTASDGGAVDAEEGGKESEGGGEGGEEQQYPSEAEMLRMLEAAHALAQQQAKQRRGGRAGEAGEAGGGGEGNGEQPSEAEMLRILEAANERALQDAARARALSHQQQQHHHHHHHRHSTHRQQPADVAKDISMQVLGGFSAVTRMARGMLAAAPAAMGEAMGGLGGMGGMGGYEGRLLGGRDAEERMPAADAWGGGWGGEEEEEEEGESEGSLSRLTTIKGSTEESTGVGEFELLDDFQDNSSSLVPPRPLLPPLSADEWRGYQDSEGRVSEANREAVLQRIFYSGMDPQLRSQVWPRLLGYVPWDASHAEREELRQRQITAYNSLLLQWQSISEEQARRFTKYRERCSRIDKDVVRTDRHLPFFAGEGNENLERVRRILITYAFYNFDLGYCQGMGDLLAPLLMVLGDEVEAFWAFTAYMETMAPNFHRDQSGMHAQLQALSQLVQLVDPPLYEYLESVDCLNFFFCFRWILVRFKREFEFEDTCRLWEALWSCHLSQHLHLFVAAAVLKRHRRRIMDEQMEFDSLLKFANDLSCHIDLDAALRDAEALCVLSGERGQACMPVPPPPLEEMFEGPETGEEEVDD